MRLSGRRRHAPSMLAAASSPQGPLFDRQDSRQGEGPASGHQPVPSTSRASLPAPGLLRDEDTLELESFLRAFKARQPERGEGWAGLQRWC